jgi:hypothetical protein
MCSCYRPWTDYPSWRDSVHDFVWRHRDSPRSALGLAGALAALAGVAAYQLAPTDIERAEADLQKARTVIVALDAEADAALKGAKGHKLRAADHRRELDTHPDVDDAEWRAWQQAMADGHARLHRAKEARRDTLLHLTAEYLRLLAEAEGEILRAKDARDRGTPHAVAPRVRDLLAPVLNAR